MEFDVLLRNARFGVLLLLVLALLGVLYFLTAVLLPFALAIFLAYLLNPLVNWLHGLRVGRLHVHRGAAILGIYAVLVGLLVLSGLYLVPRFTVEVNRMVRELPSILHSVETDYVRPLEQRLDEWAALLAPDIPEPVEPQVENLLPGETPEDALASNGEKAPLAHAMESYTFVVRQMNEESYEVIARPKRAIGGPGNGHEGQFKGRMDLAFGQLRANFEENFIELALLSRTYLQDVLRSFFSGFLVFMIAGFVLIDPQRISSFMRSMVPPDYQSNYARWLERLDRGLSGVVRGQVVICLVNGVLTGVGLAFIGVPFVVTLSVIAGIFSLIPIFGVLLSTVPILLMALTVSLSSAVLALVWVLVIHFIEGNFLNPKILGDSARIHPALVVFALVAGEHLGGVVGALLAVPTFSLLLNSFLFLKSLVDEAQAGT